MAKLSSRGRTAQVEATREYDETVLQQAHDRYQASFVPNYQPGSDPSLTVWERSTRRLMSDGKILEKRDVRFRPDQYDPNGRRHSYGWKVRATLKPTSTPEAWAEGYRAVRKSGKSSPWIVTTQGLAPIRVISQARIMRAVESGESVGFCVSCGAETTGVEPDARGYTCESCGKPDVSGAEELLIGCA